MGEMAALWSYEENHDMEQLGQQLLYTTLELEKVKSEAMEEIRKNKEYIKQLIHLLTYAIQERDEARNQLHNLLLINKHNNNFSLTTKTAESSDNLSETYNYHSHGSSPVESLFEGNQSSELSNVTLVVQDTNPLILNTSNSNNNNNNNNNNQVNPVIVPTVVDQGLVIIDNLVRGRVLPQKGKFLQAVLRAGPLLQTLLVAGPLPKWRNPPQFQPFQVPPLPIKACEVSNVVGQLGSRLQSFDQVPCGPVQVQPGYVLNFGNMAPNGPLVESGMNDTGYAPLPKRQRFS
ncbi:hypothetical protein OROGR_019787 [Orobanche gracilis]